MPRPNKTYRRQKINAAIAWKRGDRKEAYKLWEKAAKGIQEHREAKHKKTKPAEESGESTEPAE